MSGQTRFEIQTLPLILVFLVLSMLVSIIHFSAYLKRAICRASSRPWLQLARRERSRNSTGAENKEEFRWSQRRWFIWSFQLCCCSRSCLRLTSFRFHNRLLQKWAKCHSMGLLAGHWRRQA